MNKLLNSLIKNFNKVVIIYFVIQVLLVIFWQQPFKSDSQYYYKLAEDCLKYHSLYPAKAQLFENYIIAPLYVNLLIAVLSIYNSLITIGILNIFLNALQMLLFFKLSEKLTDRSTAIVCALLYMFYLNMIGMVLMNLTEIFFEIFVLAALLYFYRDTAKSMFAAGILTAASIAVRPVGWGLALAFILVLLTGKSARAGLLNKVAALILGTAIFIFAYGGATQIFFGKFVFTASTGPLNLIIGANNDATGAYNYSVFEQGNPAYIQNPGKMTYEEKGNLWEHETEKWIIAHPVKWLSLMPAKIFYMFAYDDFTLPYLTHMDGLYVPRFIKTVFRGGLGQVFAGRPILQVILYLIFLILNYIYYLTIVVIFLMRIIKERAYKDYVNRYLPVIIFTAAGLLITLAAYGDARYKYPYMLFAIFFIAEPVSRYIKGQKLFSTITA